MKKTYMQPATMLTKVAVHRMICQSTFRMQIDDDSSVGAENVGSRRGRNNFWDDEDDE